MPRAKQKFNIKKYLDLTEILYNLFRNCFAIPAETLNILQISLR